jgi:hypothetical protein
MILSCNPHWKGFATLLPNYWLAEIPQALALMRLGRQSAERDFKAKLIGTGVRDSCGKSASKGDPAGVKTPRADRPRKASALRFNQRL